MRRNVASLSFRRHVPTRFLINQCQIITFLILKSDIIENSRIELREIVLPVASNQGGWSGGAKVLGKLPVPGRPTNLDYSRARAYCACSRCGWGCLDIFSLICHFSFLSPSLWETARYRLKYCLKGPLSPKQPTNLQIKFKLHLLLFYPSTWYICDFFLFHIEIEGKGEWIIGGAKGYVGPPPPKLLGGPGPPSSYAYASL